MSIALCDHPEIEHILTRLVGMGYGISPASLRLDDLTETIVSLLRESGERSITIAPETGSDRLRRVINQRLGHRNFNAFVNGFRLAETMAALADPSKRGLPVLTIALTAGFQSIGPFNRAFKAATGLTPTEFRRQKLAES